MKKVKKLVFVAVLALVLGLSVVVLAACPDNRHEVTFRNGNETLTALTQRVNDGEFATEPTAAQRPTAPSGYEWRHWSAMPNGDTPFAFVTTPITQDTVLYAVFRHIATDATITILAIPGVAVPIAGATPATAITPTAQYTGTIAWTNSPAIFSAATVYTATITLTPLTGFTFQGIVANTFTVAGATTVTHAENSGVVTAVFPATGASQPQDDEFEIDFYLGFDATAIPAVKTVNSMLATLPVAPARAGYTFQGWWVSMLDNVNYLTHQAVAGQTVFAEDTTLFALWFASGVIEPLVQVTAAGVSWNAVPGATNYILSITGQGTIPTFTATGMTLNRLVNFAAADAGDFVITVTTEGTNASTVTRFFRNHALARVSLDVDGNELSWNDVGADVYRVMFTCGEGIAHNIDRGSNLTFDFSSFAIPANGFNFTVRAEAVNFAASISRAKPFNRILQTVTGFDIDAAQIFSWNSVPNATSYDVEVAKGTTVIKALEGITVPNISLAYVDRGQLTITVTPRAFGWNTVDTNHPFMKEALARPQNLEIDETILLWNAVTGATSYQVRITADGIGNIYQVVNAPATELNLTELLPPDTEFEITVRARYIEDIHLSPWSAVRPVSTMMFTTFTYENRIVTWVAVLGVTRYEVRINGDDGNLINVTTETTASIPSSAFVEAGDLTIEIRAITGDIYSAWVSRTFAVFTLSFYDAEGYLITELFAAGTDIIRLPATVAEPKYGHILYGWSLTEGGTAVSATHTVVGDQVFYAIWVKGQFTVTLDAAGGTALTMITEPIMFGAAFNLGRAVHTDGTGFVGWYVMENDQRVFITDELGRPLNNEEGYVLTWAIGRNVTLYAYWAQFFTFAFDIFTGGYAVSTTVAINAVSNVFVPESVGGTNITVIRNFRNRSNLTDLNLPNTIQIVEENAFTGSNNINNINVAQGSPYIRSIYGVVFAIDPDVHLGWQLIVFPTGREGIYTVPSEGIVVTRIGPNAFRGAARVEEVILPPSVTTLANNSFDGTTALKTINLPVNLTHIAAFAFRNSGLTSIDIPNTVTNIGANAFQNTNINEVILPNGLIEIGAFAFANTSITDIIIPGSVTLIGASAFSYNFYLNSVYFAGGGDPNNPLFVGARVFSYSSSLSDVKFNATSALNLISSFMFNNTDLIEIEIPASVIRIQEYAFNGNTNLAYVTFASGSNLDIIESNAFRGWTASTMLMSLGAIEIPASVTRIAGSAFIDSGITALSFENGSQIEIIEGSAFANTSRLTSVSLPEGLLTIGLQAFNQSAFATITIPSTVQDRMGYATAAAAAQTFMIGIGNSAFQRTTAGRPPLTGVTFTPNINPLTIGTDAFNGAQITELLLPQGFRNFNQASFNGLNRLEALNISPLNTALISVGGNVFTRDGDDPAIFLFAPQGLMDTQEPPQPLTVITIPDEATRIGERAFLNLATITRINIPASVEIIPINAFEGMTNLAYIYVAAGNPYFSSIDGVLFRNITIDAVSGLELVYFPLGRIPTGATGIAATYVVPANVISIGAYAFSGIANAVGVGSTTVANNRRVNLNQITLPNGLIRINHRAFHGLTNLTGIHIPNTVQYIGFEAFRTIGTTVPLVEGRRQTTTVTFADNSVLTTIAAGAFFGATFLRHIIIPASVIHIGAFVLPNQGGAYPAQAVVPGAFENMWTAPLAQVILEEEGVYPNVVLRRPHAVVEFESGSDLQVIGNRSFFGVTLLNNIQIPAAVTRIGQAAFQNIGSYAAALVVTGQTLTPTIVNFGGATSQLQIIGSSAFEGALRLASITIPAGVRDVFFEGTPAIQGSQIVPATPGFIQVPQVAHIQATRDRIRPGVGDRAFFNNHALTEVFFTSGSDHDLTIGIQAFAGTTAASINLNTINIPARVVEIGNNAFQNRPTLATVNFDVNSRLRRIGTSAFSGITSMTQISIPNSVRDLFVEYQPTIGGADALPLIPASVDNPVAIAALAALAPLPAIAAHTVPGIGANAFSGNINLRDITFIPGTNHPLTLPNGVFHNIPASVVIDDVNVPTVVNLPARVHNFEWNTFSGTATGVNVVLHDESDMFMTAGVLFRNIYTADVLTDVVLVRFPTNKDVELYEIPDYVTIIGPNAFNGSVYVEHIVVPNSVREIGDNAFQNSGLQELELLAGSQLRHIGASAFMDAASLKYINIELALQLETMGNAIFIRTASLDTIIFPDQLTELGSELFAQSAVSTVHLPGSLLYFERAQGISPVGQQIAGHCIFDGTVNLTTLTIGTSNRFVAVNNILFTYDMTTLLHYPRGLTATSFSVPSGVTRIGNTAFANQPHLEVVNLPASVTAIGRSSFRMSTVRHIVIETGSNLTLIEGLAFQFMNYLESINLQEGLAIIRGNAFEHTAIPNIIIPFSVTIIENHAFSRAWRGGVQVTPNVYVVGRASGAVGWGAQWLNQTGQVAQPVNVVWAWESVTTPFD